MSVEAIMDSVLDIPLCQIHNKPESTLHDGSSHSLQRLVVNPIKE